MFDLIVCIRCHIDPDLVFDTFRSIQHYTDPKQTLVICAVDGRPKIAERLKKLVGKDKVYCSKQKWGWGAGLYSLLLESIEWAEARWTFHHFCSVDYDTYFIGEQADTAILDYINSPTVGLIGNYTTNNHHWARIFGTEHVNLDERFGKIPSTYIPGEGVQGGMLLLTRALIDRMKKKGMFLDPYRNAKKYTTIADDHLLPIFVRMCGLRMVNSAKVTRCEWTASEDPRGLETEGIKIFHPTKLKPRTEGTTAERQIRNYFRKLRGEKPLPLA